MIKTFDFDFLKNTFKQLELYNLKNKRLGLAISGGEDSCVLLNHFLKIKNKTDVKLSVVHVHHGLTSSEETNSFRKSSLEFVRELAQVNGLEFFTNEIVKSEDSSEENLRNIRIEFFKTLSLDAIVTGHHKMDLLETRLIRLFRGSGPQGLEAMKEWDEEESLKFFRPLLSWEKSFIQEYLKKENLNFIADPSNKDSKYFRNWIRNELLTKVQDYRPGAVESLERSLQLIVDKIKHVPGVESFIISESGIDRQKLLILSKNEQRSVVAAYLHRLHVKGYSHSHVDEILKRLDSSQKELTFTLLGLSWSADSRCVAATTI